MPYLHNSSADTPQKSLNHKDLIPRLIPKDADVDEQALWKTKKTKQTYVMEIGSFWALEPVNEAWSEKHGMSTTKAHLLHWKSILYLGFEPVNGAIFLIEFGSF